MMITLKDGSVREYANGTTAMDNIAGISEELARRAVAAMIDGRTADLSTPIRGDASLTALTFDDEKGREVYRHTCSHILAQAVKRLYPEAKPAIGPAIENGFYYDFDVDRPFSAEDFDAIEAEMQKIIGEKLPLLRFELPRVEAMALMEKMGEPYKVELIRDLPEDAVISFYRQGEYTDLCAGPHLPDTGRVRAVKLLSTAGAYWRGSEKNKMLQRIYGTAFDGRKELRVYLEGVEEARKRDHNKLGRELHYFTNHEAVGQGLPLFMPKGAKMLQILQRFVEDEEQQRGYLLTRTPLMAKSDLYKISGHWDHYRDGMFIMGNEDRGDEVLALRPMTCPFQFMIYKADHHSYRELPLRYSESATLFRNEASGEMHGLIRVRQFTLADGHIICRPDQVEDEFIGVLDLIGSIMKILGIDGDIRYRFSKWDPRNRQKYIDNPKAWDSTQAMMKQILDHVGLDYTEADDEAAFYGPKLDVQFRNVFGKEDTLFTVQIDFALAERFDMSYIDEDNQKKRPFIIHRSSIGCYERTLAMLIEKYAGSMPLWLAPEQVRILSITDRADGYVNELKGRLIAAGLRAAADLRNEKIGFKIREGRNERVPYLLIIGDKEMADGAVAVRRRDKGDMGVMAYGEFEAMVRRENHEKIIF